MQIRFRQAPSQDRTPLNSFSTHCTVERWLLVITCCLLALPVSAFDYFQALPEQPLVPRDNAMTAAKIDLGKTLFFDPRLSMAGNLTCDSCHSLSSGANDGRAVSMGAASTHTRRSSPTLLNIGLQTVYFWDGRSKSLENLVVEHLSAPDIMGVHDLVLVERRLQALEEYQIAFNNAFGDDSPALTTGNIAKALATFMRSLMTPGSRFDLYIKGDATALSALEKKGMELFNQVGCLACHFGVNFAGPAPGPAMQLGDGFYELFPNHPGTAYDSELRLLDDLGVYEVTKNPADKRLWRVPPLRNIALTAPYFHNGSAPDLESAIRVMAITQLKKELNTQEVTAIKAFLVALTGVPPDIKLPVLPNSPGVSFRSFVRQ